jgi:hypothetical protein
MRVRRKRKRMRKRGVHCCRDWSHWRREDVDCRSGLDHRCAPRNVQKLARKSWQDRGETKPCLSPVGSARDLSKGEGEAQKFLELKRANRLDC